VKKRISLHFKTSSKRFYKVFPSERQTVLKTLKGLDPPVLPTGRQAVPEDDG
jgi:hypothetical protein